MISNNLRQSRSCLGLLLRRRAANTREHELLGTGCQQNVHQKLFASQVAKKPAYSLTGIDSIKAADEESYEETCLFPMLQQLGITTQSRNHSIQLSCDSVIKYIKIGVINKQLTVQYCHYLAHLCRDAEPTDLEYYTARVINLIKFILKKYPDLPKLATAKLLVDSASTSEAICTSICGELIDEQNLWSIVGPSSYTTLLEACYKFKLWKMASSLLDKNPGKQFYWRAFDALIISATELLNDTEITFEEKERHKHDLLAHLQKLIITSRQCRIQLFTKQPDQLVQCLENLFPDVSMRPIIKMSGRCTRCNTHIPLYDNESVLEINKSIRQVLDTRQMGDLHLYSNKSDIEGFYSFVERLHDEDKRPLDCVIDGLNLAYKNSQGHVLFKQKLGDNVERTRKKHDPQFQVQALVNAILRSNFLEKFRRVLVIGKAHMNRWPGLLDFFEKNNIHFYASANEAKDDLFMLYAATLSPKTFLVTNDFLRDHLALLNPEQRIRLERYIDTRQVWIDNKTLRAIWPTPYEKLPYVDETCDHFHIPMIDYNKIDLLSQHQPPPHLNGKLTTWLCCSTAVQPKRIRPRDERTGPIEENSTENPVL